MNSQAPDDVVVGAGVVVDVVDVVVVVGVVDAGIAID